MLRLQGNWQQMLDFPSYLPHKSASGGVPGTPPAALTATDRERATHHG